MGNIVLIYYSFFSRQVEASKFSTYMSLLPAWKRHRIDKFRRWQDAQASLFGSLLLLEGLKYLGQADIGLEDIQLSSYNRPYLDAGPDFNISHSGQYVVCALSSKGKVGIDIEEMLPVEITDFDSLFRTDELDDITLSPMPVDKFYEYWTKKEAVVKADGKGLNIDLAAIQLAGSHASVDDKEWYLREICLDNFYKTHIAAEHSIAEMILKKVSF